MEKPNEQCPLCGQSIEGIYFEANFSELPAAQGLLPSTMSAWLFTCAGPHAARTAPFEWLRRAE